VNEYDRVIMKIDKGHIVGTGPCDTYNLETRRLVGVQVVSSSRIVCMRPSSVRQFTYRSHTEEAAAQYRWPNRCR
jgi:hypothetical protein